MLEHCFNLGELHPHVLTVCTDTTPDSLVDVINSCDAVNFGVGHVTLRKDRA